MTFYLPWQHLAANEHRSEEHHSCLCHWGRQQRLPERREFN